MSWTGTLKDGLITDITDAVREKMADDLIYLPNEIEMMAARGAIVSLVDSVAHGNLEPRSEVLDGIILSVVRSLRWRPYDPGCDGKCARDECVCPQ